MLLKNVTENINRTIGVACQILGYDNSVAQKSICEVYNRGVLEAKYNILCFMHEDIEISTKEWGKEVHYAFESNSCLGLLGVAGSQYKSLSPSPWYGSKHAERLSYMNLLQRYRYSTAAEEHKYSNIDSLSISKVAVIDGLWFCGRRDIMLNYAFDQNLLTKFHGYDIDISLFIGQHYDICVTFGVLLTHFSEGNYKKEWVKETLLVQKKWEHILPVNKAGLNIAESTMCEKFAFKYFVNTMRKSGFSSYSCIKVLNNSMLREKFGWLLYARLLIKCLSA